jgi:phytoene synthase
MSKDNRDFAEIFRRGSRTYFNSTRFFPPRVRRDVTYLYAFVRTADDFVDRLPQDREGFEAFRRTYLSCRNGHASSGGPVVDGILELSGRRGFEPAWLDAFLDSMAMDLTKKEYKTIDEVMAYMYGSAEVIGLMMARIMGLSDEASVYARLLGRAMQFINFLRDIREDSGLGRCYFPADEIREVGLESLAEDDARSRPDIFLAFIRKQIARYREWKAEAEKGYALIPWRCRIPIRTATDMYDWTARRIEADPFIVYGGTVKPSRVQIFQAGFRNIFRIRGSSK